MEADETGLEGKEKMKSTDTLRILIVGEEREFSTNTAHLLQKEGFTCDMVQDADSAISALQEARYDLLVTDIQIQDNGDLKFIENVAEMFPKLPVVVLTGRPSVDTAVRSLSLPIFAYLVKPLEEGRFLEQARAAIQWSRVNRIIDEARYRNTEVMQNAAMAHSIAAMSMERSMDNSLHTFLGTTFGTVAGAITDLNKLFAALSLGKNSESLCMVVDCPRVQVLEEAIERAIEILRSTKGSFKSNEIGALRRELEAVLNAERSKLRGDNS